MKFCSGRVCQGVLVLAVLIVLFTLSSFVKEQSTKPSRYQFTVNMKGRDQELLQKATSQATKEGQRTSIHAESGQEEGPLKTTPGPAAHAAGVGRRAETNQTTSCTEQRASLQRQEKDQTVNTAPPRGQGQELTSVRAEKAVQADRDGETTQRRDQPRKHQGAAGTQAKTLPASRLPGADLAKTSREALATAPVPAKDKVAQVTPSPGPWPSPTTQRRQILKAKNFKSEPRWDFEEKYSFDVGGLQTTCPDSVKVRAAKSPWLWNLFLPNLTLFLDSSHFNQSEWDRLEHFAPPFGFMELNQSLVQKVVVRFAPVPQQQLLLASLPAGSSRCITCAVVGNGGILNNSHVGQEIDSHDYVFRLSGAVIKGYEQDVGTRTSFYGFTTFSLSQSIFLLGNRGFQQVPLDKDIRYLHFLEGSRDYEWLETILLNHTLERTKLFWIRPRSQEALREALNMNRYLLLHPDFLRYMKNRFLRSKSLDTVHWRIYRPTTGAFLLLSALHLCDKVSAYGFITKNHRRFSEHYYDKSLRRLVFYINHDFGLEKNVWKRLHDEGIIRLYQRP